jgi:hypothetical protein
VTSCAAMVVQVVHLLAWLTCRMRRRHVNACSNSQLLKWWRAIGYKKSPHMRVYKSADQIPAALLDAAEARGTSGKAKRSK